MSLLTRLGGLPRPRFPLRAPRTGQGRRGPRSASAATGAGNRSLEVLRTSGATTVAEIGVGAGGTSREIAAWLAGRGELHLFGVEDVVGRVEQDLAGQGLTNVRAFGHPRQSPDAWTWSLARLLQDTPEPVYDYVLFAGGQSFAVDALAVLLADRLLKPGGYLDLDDASTTAGSSRVEEWLATIRDLVVGRDGRYEEVTADRVFRKATATPSATEPGEPPAVDAGGFRQADYWLERHEKHVGDPRSVGNFRYSVEANLETEDRLRAVVRRAAQLLRPAATVLDVGCGYGRVSSCFTDEGYDYLGVDVSPTAVAQGRERNPAAHFVTADLATWDTEDRFDVVVVLYVFVHFVDDQAWTSILERCMSWVRPGGALLVADQFPAERDQPATHVVSRPWSDYSARALARGFTVDEAFSTDLAGQGDSRLPGSQHFRLLRKAP